MLNIDSLRPTLDVLDAADYLKVSKYTIINRIKEGKLNAYKQGKHWKIKREWLLEYEESLVSGNEWSTHQKDTKQA
ncbi:helix-turn-helix domain-containing protein [Paenibacillus sp. IHBB 3054]|uniref:helix-turn-helix domain-containing protein n=1 Tax=Paenibacillus sp. IHBB 3054 TaxID=3425689 RepID=UPI003F66E599